MALQFDGSGKVIGGTEDSGSGGGESVRVLNAFARLFGFTLRTGDPNSNPLSPSSGNIASLLATWQGLLGKLDSPGWAGSLLALFKNCVSGAITDHGTITDHTHGISEMMLNLASAQQVSSSSLGEFSSPIVGTGQGIDRGVEI